jgi:PAS domain S-box-containing protein
MNWRLTIYVWLMLVPAAIAAGTALYAWRRRAARGARALVALMIACLIFALTGALEAAAVGIPNKVFWSRVQYFGAMTSPVLFLIFALDYGRHARWLTPRTILGLMIVPAIGIALAWTNDAHHLIWEGFIPSPVGDNLLIYVHGPAFWLIIAYLYAAVLIGTVGLLRVLRQAHFVYRSQTIVVLIAALAPWLGSIIYVFDLSPIPGLDVTPLSFAVMGVLLAVGVLRYRLFDLTPIAREAIVEGWDDGLIVLDQHRRVIDMNQAARRLLGLSAAPIGDLADDVFAAWPEMVARYRDLIEAQAELQVAERWLELRINPVTDRRGVAIGRVITLRDITVRRQAEDELRRLKEFNENIVQNMAEGIVLEDAAGHMIFVNPAAARLLGYTPDELIDRHWTFVMPPDQWPIVEAIDQQRQSGQASRYELDLLRRDGTRLPVLVTGSPRFDVATGVFIGTVAVFTDITERKRTEEALRTSETLYHTLVETLPVSIFRKDAEGRFTFANTRFCQGQNKTLAEIVGKTDFDLHPSALAEKYREDDRRLMAAGRVFETEEIHQTKDGAPTYVQTIKTPIFAGDGRVIGVQGMFWDITERKRAEAALAQRARELAALYETALDISAQGDLHALLEAIVRRAASLLNAHMGGLYLLKPDHQTLELVVSYNLPRNYQGTQLKLGEGLSGVVAQTGQALTVEDYSVWPGRASVYDGDVFRRVLGVPLKMGQRVLGVLNVTDAQQTGRFTDDQIRVTSLLADQAAVAIEQMRLYQTIQQHAAEMEQHVAARTRDLNLAYQQLRELNHLKDQFVSRISHELRTPLANIQLYLKLLRVGRSERQADYLETLTHETARLSKLIEDLLTISQLDREHAVLQLTPVNVNQLVVQWADDWRMAADARNLHLHVSLADDVPLARSEPDRLFSALDNLMTNALNYTPAGGTVRCTTGWQALGGQVWVTICVADDGPGLAADELTHLFERFYRGHAARNYKVPGTGLGLAITKEIIEQLDGRVSVDSQPGQGAAFYLWLPAAL